MSSTCNERPLGEICQIISGQSPAGININRNEEGIPFYQGVRDFGVKYPTKSFWTDAPKKFAQAGDILVSVRAPVGRVNLAEETIAIGRGVTAVRANGGTSQSWLYQLFKYMESDWDAHESGGSVFTNLSRESLSNRKVLVPSIGEQHEIGAALDAFDNLIATNYAIQANLFDNAEAFFRLHCSPTRIESEGANWNLTTLGDALEVLETGKRPVGGVKGIREGLPSIGAESIVKIGVFDFSKTKYVPVDFASNMKSGHFLPNDVLIYKDGGKPGEFKPHVTMFGEGFPFDDFVINEHVFRARLPENLSQAFLYFWLNTPEMLARMANAGTGAAIPGINSNALRSLPFAIPPEPIKQKVFPVLDNAASSILKLAKEIEEIEKARSQVLSLIFSGKLVLDGAS